KYREPCGKVIVCLPQEKLLKLLFPNRLMRRSQTGIIRKTQSSPIIPRIGDSIILPAEPERLSFLRMVCRKTFVSFFSPGNVFLDPSALGRDKFLNNRCRHPQR